MTKKESSSLSFLDYVKLYAQGILLFCIYLPYFATVRIKGKKQLKNLLKTQEPNIFAFFHQDLFTLFKALRKPKSYIMASKSNDGKIFATLLRLLLYKIIWGSRNKGGKEAMYKSIALFQERKMKNLLIAVDGSKGPIYRVKAGAIKIALESKVQIIPVGLSYSKYWFLSKTWDKTIIPKPFSNVKLSLGKPIRVSKEDNFEEKRLLLEQELQELKNPKMLKDYLIIE